MEKNSTKSLKWLTGAVIAPKLIRIAARTYRNAVRICDENSLTI